MARSSFSFDEFMQGLAAGGLAGLKFVEEREKRKSTERLGRLDIFSKFSRFGSMGEPTTSERTSASPTGIARIGGVGDVPNPERYPAMPGEQGTFTAPEFAAPSTTVPQQTGVGRLAGQRLAFTGPIKDVAGRLEREEVEVLQGQAGLQEEEAALEGLSKTIGRAIQIGSKLQEHKATIDLLDQQVQRAITEKAPKVTIQDLRAARIEQLRAMKILESHAIPIEQALLEAGATAQEISGLTMQTAASLLLRLTRRGFGGSGKGTKGLLR